MRWRIEIVLVDGFRDLKKKKKKKKKLCFTPNDSNFRSSLRCRMPVCCTEKRYRCGKAM